MRARISAGMAVAAIIAAVPAQAADLFGPLRGTQNAHRGLTPVESWQGAYFGGFAGSASGQSNPRRSFQNFLARELRLNDFANRNAVSGWLSLPAGKGQDKNFGVFAGYNYQYDEAVLGFEADFTRMKLRMDSRDSQTRSLNDLIGIPGLAGEPGVVTMSGRSTLEIKDLFTLRGRAGYTVGSFMPFVTAGLAVASFDATRTGQREVLVTNTGQILIETYGPQRKSGYAFGFAGGAGVDVAVGANGFLRGEWQYAHFRDIEGMRATLNNFRAAAGVKF